ncbi:MAG: ThiF family adenylyltransferase [Actinomycetes bacterium]
MRPMLVPGMRWAWRSPTTAQFGIDVPEPVVVGGLPAFGHQLLPLLDGARADTEVVATVRATSSERLAASEVRAVIDRLVDLGVVIDGGSWPGTMTVTADWRAQLAPDLRCASATERFRAQPAARWARLAASEVVIMGASRLGATIARTLLHAGLGRVGVRDSHNVSPADVSVGGYTTKDVGLRRSEWLSTHPRDAHYQSSGRIDRSLVVVTDAVDTDSLCRSLATTDKPHLVASCSELVGRVGPLVEPGRSPCAFCLALARRDQDPQWPTIWRQQQITPTPDADAILVGLTAYLSVAHVLDWLTGGSPPSLGGFVETSAPHGKTSSRQFSQHPECGCTWPDSSASPTMAG